MSRLIVKNIPAYTTPVQLKAHFSQSSGPGGTITDVKVALKRDGTSRRFGFVGYKTEKEAQAARDWFNGAFLGESKMQVSVVEGIKDAPLPRPNKRRKLDPSPTEDTPAGEGSSKKKSNEESKKPKGTEDTQLDQFLKVMQPKTKKGPSWANEPQESLLPVPPEVQDEASEEDNDHGRMEEGISDLDWMKRRMTKNVDNLVVDGNDTAGNADVADHTKSDREHQPAEDPAKETILRTSRLFLRNLAFSCTDADLLELFSPFGDVSQVHIPLDPKSKEPKGMAYVTFSKPTCAVTAYEALDKKSFQGRLLHILPAVDRRGNFQVEEGDGKRKSVKEEKNSKRKSMAGKDFNWSMLYMNSDAVASSIADRMSIPKSMILNPESSDESAAVKLALAETHIINETRTYLEAQGVILSSFSPASSNSSSRVRRSDTVILVKNIPYGTSIEDIRAMFEVYGDLERVLVPPAGTMAVVEFKHADEAGKAFKGIVYRRMGSSVIYLEKGPLGLFGSHDNGEEGKREPTTASGFKPITIAEQEEAQEEEPGIAEGSTLFIKNLSFSTTSDRLSQVFKSIPAFSFARVQTKPDPKKPGGTLSMGYGFVGFKNVESAKKAMKGLQGYVLDGHALHVKFAGRGKEDDLNKDKTVSKSRTTKMLVKNVPFEATKKDIRDLFSAHGHLKSVRLPKKFDSRSRGFAFLEFVTRQEAENAFAALRHTHLLGRHLVLEWAEEGEQHLDLLRQKAGVGFGGGEDMPGKKRKLQMGDGGGDMEDIID